MEILNLEEQSKIWEKVINHPYSGTMAENNISLMLYGRSKDYKPKGIAGLIDIDTALLEQDVNGKYIGPGKRMFCMTLVDKNTKKEDLYSLFEEYTVYRTQEGIKEWIITDGERYWFIPTDKFEKVECLDLDNAWQRLVKIVKNPIDFEPQGLWPFILETFHSIPLECDIVEELNSLEFADEDFECDNYYFFLNEEKERILLQKLLHLNFDVPAQGEIHRYISQNALGRLLITDTSLSMSGLAGMNDMSEFYLPSNLNHEPTQIIDRIGPSIQVKKENGFFIHSFCSREKKDDLTMWRLYGDDGQGACLTFSYDLNKLKSKGFLLFHVSYLTPINRTRLENLSSLNGEIEYNNRFFIIRNLAFWKHFTKPDEFQDEQEIRLLINIGNLTRNHHNVEQEWIRNPQNGIYHPIIKIPFKDYPLSLKSITLGPKFPLIDVNYHQVGLLCKQLDPKIQLKKSSIKYYR